MKKRTFYVLSLAVWVLMGPSAFQQTTTFAPAVQVARLQQAILKYQALAQQNQWVFFKENVCFKAEESDTCHVDLRQNLLLTGDLPATVAPEDSTYDAHLQQAVRWFQRRHGLPADGVVGNQTLEALNVSPAQRLRQLQVNLQRRQEAAAQVPERQVLVNIPNFTLHLLDSTGREAWQTRVVVGQPGEAYQTLPLESRIGYLVLNPTWTVPQSIFRREIIPLMRRDPAYLARNRMQLFRLSGTTRTLVSPASVNWHRLDPAKEPYLVVQSPGANNALGRIKFMFANPHDIYLHDTPAKALFQHPTRVYSHGCVRVQHPETLATYLLNHHWPQNLPPAPLLKQTSPEKAIFLPTPVKVKLAYYTSWVDDAGQLHFRKDLYGLDRNALLWFGL
ncbi:murein L,D-transpeptidase [Rufibacter glacialis]|uniref:L,D-transpeptidase family protein n=1 Tax=Rufibacter glacialis TaxID=1259555 RepID=A0A5M8Q433_9BACT|nr:L,D-transpeptidase family protein [Rufibacter glacialis]KAA6430647.1 L,D-transpeptidase family protein [Rufibacter glacialis]GGK85430.1 cell wall degradation protein [Rufibacter glacialis]